MTRQHFFNGAVKTKYKVLSKPAYQPLNKQSLEKIKEDLPPEPKLISPPKEPEKIGPKGEWTREDERKRKEEEWQKKFLIKETPKEEKKQDTKKKTVIKRPKVQKIRELADPYLLVFQEPVGEKSTIRKEGKTETVKTVPKQKQEAFDKLLSTLKSPPNTEFLETKNERTGKDLYLYFVSGKRLLSLTREIPSTFVQFPKGFASKDAEENPFDGYKEVDKTFKAEELDLGSVLRDAREQWSRILTETAKYAEIPAIQLGGNVSLDYARFLSKSQPECNYYIGGEPAGDPGAIYVLSSETDSANLINEMVEFGVPALFFRSVKQLSDVEDEFKDQEPKTYTPQNCIIVTAEDKFGTEKENPAVILERKFKKIWNALEDLAPTLNDTFLKALDNLVAKEKAGDKEIKLKFLKEYDEKIASKINQFYKDYVNNKNASSADVLELVTEMLDSKKDKAQKILTEWKLPPNFVQVYPVWRNLIEYKIKPKLDNILAYLSTSTNQYDIKEKLMDLGFSENDSNYLISALLGGDDKMLNALAQKIGSTIQNPGTFIKGQEVWGSMVVHYNKDLTKAIVWGSTSPITMTKDQIIENCPFIKDVSFDYSK